MFADVGRMGLIYLVAAIVLGAVFVGAPCSSDGSERPTRRRPMRLFSYSISYVTLLFGAMALDQLVKVGR